MVITFVSNYINHHQIPFCNAMDSIGDDIEFHFIQTSPMEEERIKMGWAVNPKDFPYVLLFYDERERCENLIRNSDVVIFGWSDDIAADIERERLSSGKLSFRMSERIYREGQWKAVSPKGLIKKYGEHFIHRNDPVYLLCTGAYVASDFNLIHCYPDKKLKWGYFPEKDSDDKHKVSFDPDKIRICWAGRLIKLKHPEFAVEAARLLSEIGYDYELEIIGDGYMMNDLRELISRYRLDSKVFLKGMQSPDNVRKAMRESDVFLFTSNYLEGWGAVVNEAMESGCAVVASKEAGAVPFLIDDDKNGLVYENGSLEDFKNKVLYLFETKDKILQFGINAKKTIDELWNSQNAATEFVRFCREYMDGHDPQPADYGPMSIADNIKPAGFIRTMQEVNHLE